MIVHPGEIQRVGTRFVALTDAMALAHLAALLRSRGTPFELRENRFTSFDDLRSSPAVLVGMFSNAWTLRLGSTLRFTPVVHEETSSVVISDRQHPERLTWSVRDPWPSMNVTHDYALVSRVRDPVTGSLVVIGAGITPYGTTAAVEWLTSANDLREGLANAPRDWPQRNLQIVLETQVVQGTAGPPRVVASYFW